MFFVVIADYYNLITNARFDQNFLLLLLLMFLSLESFNLPGIYWINPIPTSINYWSISRCLFSPMNGVMLVAAFQNLDLFQVTTA
jgi:hypothetical protein